MKEKKKAHGIQLLLRAVVTDPDGKVVSDTEDKPASSFLIQFLEFIRGLFNAFNMLATATNGGESYIYHISGTSAATRICARAFNADAAAGDSGKGIVIGTNTGETAEDNENYKLDTQLGSGAITHGTQLFEYATVAGANVDLVLKRAFTNLTGSTIGVKEVGIYVYQSQGGAAGTGRHCIIRDVFPGTVNVPDNHTLTIYYTLRTTV